MKKKLIIILISIIGALYTITQISSSLRLNFPNVAQSFGNKVSLVHFTAPGNDFLWSIFWLASKSVTPMNIKLGTETKLWCTKLIKGLYFNSQRGKRIRPLDSETLQILSKQNPTYNNLTISWWLYTSCTGTSSSTTWISPYGIFWAITYTRWGQTSYIVAGTALDYDNNKITPTFADSFQYFDNKVPIGYIYDSNWGIGFVGGDLSGHQNLIADLNTNWSINNSFRYWTWGDIEGVGDRTTTIKTESWNAIQTMRNLIIQWSVGLSKSINESERLSLLGNFQNQTVLYNENEINSSTLINFAKQKAQTICQGKKVYTDGTLRSLTSRELWIWWGNIVCIQNEDLIIDLTKPDTYKNKTIIVKSGNIILEGSMSSDSPALDIFLDKGLVYLPNSFERQSFNDKWFPANNGITSWLYLKGNFIINGLLVGGDGKTPIGIEWFNHKLHFQWKMTMLNTPLQPAIEKIGQIEYMFWSDYNDFINLQNVFTRTCWFDGKGSDWTPCEIGWNIATTPLVILNGNYPSKLLQ